MKKLQQGSIAEAKQKPQKSEAKNIRLVSWITPSMYECYQKEAEKRGVTVNVVVNEALSRFQETLVKKVTRVKKGTQQK